MAFNVGDYVHVASIGNPRVKPTATVCYGTIRAVSRRG
jgi:hypothetical protein